MARLIDADKLLEETRRDRDYARKNGFLDMYYERQVLIDRIESQPTAYDINVKQGGVSDDVCEWTLDSPLENDTPAEWLICPHSPKKYFQRILSIVLTVASLETK